MHFFVFFKQKTAYEMRISDWSSDVCSSDLSDFGYCLFLACPFFIETQIVVARRGGREGTGHASFIPHIGGQAAGASRKQETVERNVPQPGAGGVSLSEPLLAQSGASGNGLRQATTPWRVPVVVGPARKN